jgi:predicted CoA-substrate-specific enzyme activase
MLIGGVDVGASTTKAVIFSDGKILSYAIIPTGFDVAKAAKEVTKLACAKIDCSMAELEFVVSTGWGRNAVPFANKAVTEILGQSKGVHFLLPQARTIIDIGGQDTKVIRIDEGGNTVNFAMNDKCAAGTGRFLEVMARVLELEISEIGPMGLKSSNPCQISSTCTVFAETEVIAQRSKGKSREDLVGGIHRAVTSRVMAMVNMIGYEKQVVLTGGVCKNVAIKKLLEDEIKMELMTYEEPQITGAIGAALVAARA